MNLYFRVSQKNFIIMMICFRCARNQKKCRFFFVIRVDKNCELAMLKINFFDIDKIITKFENKNKNQDCLKDCERVNSFKTIKIKAFSKSKTIF